jgi:HD-GYP domain-containing protein (c-di-GMP phosphodiesterase class II)
VIAVVNAFDSMISDHPYRAASSIEQAIEEIRRNSGTQFDPEIVAAFLRVPHLMWRQLTEEVSAQSQDQNLVA